jgi:protein-tyrosine phosphatase
VAKAGQPRRILLVCMGNICRSPTAEAVLRVKARQARLDIEFDSAGTENYHVGEPPDPRSIRHALVRGYDLSTLRARQVHAADFHEFDLILAADELNLRELRRRCPAEQHGRLKLFLDDVALPDPYYGEGDDFEKVLDLVEKQAVLLVSRWSRPN